MLSSLISCVTSRRPAYCLELGSIIEPPILALLGRFCYVCDTSTKCNEFFTFASICEIVVYKPCDADREAVPNFVNLYLHGVNLGEIDITFLLFNSETITSLKIRELSDGNSFPLLIHEIPLYDVQFGVWGAVRATVFYESADSRRCVTDIMTPLFEYVYDYERNYFFSQQDSVSVNAENTQSCTCS